MTQGGPPPPPPDHGYPPMDYNSNISPTGQSFGDPWGADARRSQQFDKYEDVPQRVSAMGLDDEWAGTKRQSASRKPSESRRPSILRRRSTSAVERRAMSPDYELYRFDKLGEDWSEADRYVLPVPAKELEKNAKKGKSKTGTVLGQMKTMADARRRQIEYLIEEKNKKTGSRWEPAIIEELNVVKGKTGKRDVRRMDVTVARVIGVGPSRPSLSKARTNSIKGQRIVLPFRKKSYEQDEKSDRGEKGEKKKDKGDGGDKSKNKSAAVDPDPFESTKLWAPNGKPIDHSTGAQIPFDGREMLPPIILDEPIGRRPSPKPAKRGRSRRDDRDDHHDNVEIPYEIDSIPEGGAVEILKGMDMSNILPRGKKGGGRGRGTSRSKSGQRSKSRARSKSKARSRADHRGSQRSSRIGRFMHEDDSGSESSAPSILFVDTDENSSITSQTSQSLRDMHERGSLNRRRRSSKYEEMQFRPHYRGPQRRDSKYGGEPIIIPESRRLSYSRPQKQIGYEAYWPRSPSPRRAYVMPELLFPDELREADRQLDRRVDGYMTQDRLRELQLDQRERRVERRERELQRRSYGGGY